MSTDRFCNAVSRKGLVCDFREHPGNVHWTWVSGWPTPWMAIPEPWRNVAITEDPLRDAPDALREISLGGPDDDGRDMSQRQDPLLEPGGG